MADRKVLVVVTNALSALDLSPVADLVTVIERQKALGFNFVRFPFSFADLRSPPRDARYECSGPNPDACGIVQSVLKPGQILPPGAGQQRYHASMQRSIGVMTAVTFEPST